MPLFSFLTNRCIKIRRKSNTGQISAKQRHILTHETVPHGVTIRYFISCCPGLGFRHRTVNDSFGVQRSETATFETVISAVLVLRVLMADRVGEKVFRQRLQNGAALCSVQKIPFMISHKILYTPGRKITNFSG